MANVMLDLEDRLRSLEIKGCPLTDLPAELLNRILLELRWCDIIRIRRTCKSLYNVSKDKALWYHLYGESFPGVQKKLDYPIGLYSHEELERYVAQGLMSKRVWASDLPTTCIQHDIQLGEEIDRYWLSESGRWLLIMTPSGSVLYHDLDHLEIPARTLIPKHSDIDCYLSTRLAVDIDNTSPTLVFNLALYLSAKPNESHFEIWRVHLQLDSEGELPTLVAENLASFKRKPGGSLCHISLLGDELAYSLSASSVVTVVNWRTAPPAAQGNGYPTQTIAFPSFDHVALYIPLHLLPGSRLFVLTRFCLYLFRFDTQTGTSTLLWRKSMTGLKEFTLSRPYIFPETNSIRLVVSENERILGCVISLHEDDPGPFLPPIPCFITVLLDHGQNLKGRRWRASLGYRTGVAHYEIGEGAKSKLLALSYPWPDDKIGQLPTIIKKDKPGRWQGWQLGYSELTGRVVILTSKDGVSNISFLKFLLSERSYERGRAQYVTFA